MRVEKTRGACFLCGTAHDFSSGDRCDACDATSRESAIAHLLVKYSGGGEKSVAESLDQLRFRRILALDPPKWMDEAMEGCPLYSGIAARDAASVQYAADGLPFDVVLLFGSADKKTAAHIDALLAEHGILIAGRDKTLDRALGNAMRWSVDGAEASVYHKKTSEAQGFTGERFMPGIEDRKLEIEHLQRYLSVRELVKGLDVLDIACGEGYGSAFLAETAASVLGVDIDRETVERAGKKYQRGNLQYRQGDAASIPLKDHSVDAVVSFETIEHIDEALQHKFLREIDRVLKKDGILIMSTPNKEVYSDRYSYFNEFHVHEFYHGEFIDFLGAYFPYVKLYQQSFQVVSLFSACEDTPKRASWYGGPVGGEDAKYYIAVAARAESLLPEVASLYVQGTGEYEANLQRIVSLQNEETLRNLHIRALDSEMEARGARIRELQDEEAKRDAHIQAQDGELAEKGELIRRLQEEKAKRDAHIQALDSEMEARGARIRELQDEEAKRDAHIQAQDGELAEKGELIRSLQEAQAKRDAHIQAQDGELAEKGNLIRELQEEKAKRDAHIQELDSEMEARGARIRELQDEEAKRDAHIQALDGELAEKGDLIRELQEEQVKRDAHIQELDSEMEARGARIRELQDEEAKRDAHIQALDGELAEKGDLIRGLQEEQAKRDAHIQELDKEMEARGARIRELQNEEAKRDAHIRALDGELAEKGDLIRELQEEQAKRDAHIRALDGELAEKGDLIRGLQEEQEKRDAHIQELDSEMEARGARIRALDGELTEKEELIRSLRQEKSQLDDEKRDLEAACAQIAADRDHYEEQRNVLVKERDELKGYLADSKAECDGLRRTVEEKQTELNNKQGHINLLLESDRELQNIKHSRSYKLFSRWWRLRDRMIPPNSKRRLILKLMARFVRHPIWCLRRVDRDHIKKFSDGLKSGDIATTSARLDNYLGGSDVNAERPDQLPLVEFDSLEAVPALHVPSSNHPVVSIVIPVYNQFAYTYACLKSIAKNSGDVPYEVLIADDCSTDLTRQITRAISGIRVVRTKKNLRFLLNCNNAAKHAKGKYILFLNNDTQVMPNWLEPLTTLIERDAKIGMVGSKLIYPDGRLQEAGGILWRDGSAWNYGHLMDATMPEYNYVKDVDYISGAAIMIRAELWRELGGFDEQFAPAYYEDTDLAFDVREHGYRVVYQPLSVVIHFEGVSNGTSTSSGLKAYQERNQKVFYEKWKHVLEGHKPNAECVFRARERSLNKPTLLFVDHYVPEFDKDAGSRSVFGYIRMFVHQGFSVKFIGDNFYRSEPYTTVLQQLGVEVLNGDWYFLHWKEWLSQNAQYFDYAFLNRPHIAVNYIDILRQYSKAKIAYYGHDLCYLRAMREYETTGDEAYLKESEDWHAREYALMKKMDVVFYPSTVEIEMIKQEDPSINAMAIPVYIFDDVPDEQYDYSKRKDLFFIGGFAHRPNIDAIKWLASEIMPLVRKKLPDVSMHIAGSKMPNEIQALDGVNGIVIEGAVSDERMMELYRRMRMTVVPLRYGAGVKGKVIESMYYGLPCVTTSCGAEGIMGAEGVLTVADTPEGIADKIVSLYNDRRGLERISVSQREVIATYFSEAFAAKTLSDVFGFNDGK